MNISGMKLILKMTSAKWRSLCRTEDIPTAPASRFNDFIWGSWCLKSPAFFCPTACSGHQQPKLRSSALRALCEGNPLVARGFEFPLQRARNEESVSRYRCAGVKQCTFWWLISNDIAQKEMVFHSLINDHFTIITCPYLLSPYRD